MGQDVRTRLIRIRDKRKLTQMQAAIEIGCGITTYRMWEQGLIPSDRSMTKINKWLEDTTDECKRKSSTTV